jgi:flagellar biosynthetic protein FlhB
MFSAPNGVRLGFGLARIVVVMVVAGVSLYARRGELISAAAFGIDQLAVLTWQLCLWTCVKIGLALAVLSLLDYGYQRWRFEQNLRMTPQELREEMRNLQGDPAIAARRRAVRAVAAAQPLASSVPRAAVIIADKAIAVALEYQGDQMSAPLMLARGAGPTARRIRELAAEHGISVVERPSLAAALFKEAARPAPLPQVYWVEAAEVLASVRSKQKA